LGAPAFFRLFILASSFPVLDGGFFPSQHLFPLFLAARSFPRSPFYLPRETFLFFLFLGFVVAWNIDETVLHAPAAILSCFFCQSFFPFWAFSFCAVGLHQAWSHPTLIFFYISLPVACGGCFTLVALEYGALLLPPPPGFPHKNGWLFDQRLLSFLVFSFKWPLSPPQTLFFKKATPANLFSCYRLAAALLLSREMSY